MFGIEKDIQDIMKVVYGPLNKDKMTKMKLTAHELAVIIDTFNHSLMVSNWNGVYTHKSREDVRNVIADMETSIEDLVDQVEQWLPKQKFGSSQNVLGDVDIVEGFNDCLKKIKSKLR